MVDNTPVWSIIQIIKLIHVYLKYLKGGGGYAILELTTDISYTVREWQIMMKVKAIKCILNKEVQNSHRSTQRRIWFKKCYCARPLSLIKCKFYRILKNNNEILCLMCVCVCAWCGKGSLNILTLQTCLISMTLPSISLSLNKSIKVKISPLLHA